MSMSGHRGTSWAMLKSSLEIDLKDYRTGLVDEECKFADMSG